MMKKFIAVALATSAVALMVSPVSAALVKTIEQNSDHSFPIASGSLIEGAAWSFNQSSLPAWANYPRSTDFPNPDGDEPMGQNSFGDINQLTDGVYGDPGNSGDGYMMYPHDGFNSPNPLSEWYFDTADVGSIVVLSGYGDPRRVKQAWTMWTSTDNGTTWDPLTNVVATEANNGTLGTQQTQVRVTLNDSSGPLGVLVAGMNALRIQWNDPFSGVSPLHFHETSYREVQVFAPIPEPSSFVLAAAGLIGLVGTRRRIRK